MKRWIRMMRKKRLSINRNPHVSQPKTWEGGGGVCYSMLYASLPPPPPTKKSTNKAGPSEFCEVMEDRTRNMVDSNYYQASLSTIEDHCERKVCIEVMQVKYPVRGRRCPVIEQKNTYSFIRYT